jgi:hypothetical protein
MLKNVTKFGVNERQANSMSSEDCYYDCKMLCKIICSVALNAGSQYSEELGCVV